MEEKTFLTFVVMNTRLLKTGGAASHQFKQEGGYIGNDDSCHWILPDPNNALITPYCQIKFENDEYHLIDIQGGIGINDESPQFEQQRHIKVKDGDVFRIGSYQIRAHLKVVEVETEQRYRVAETVASGVQEASSVQETTPSYIPQLDIDLPAAREVQASKTEVEPSIRQDDQNKEIRMSPSINTSTNEINEPLAASIAGLLAIHSRQDNSFHLLNRSFQPIQDNPLQMGLTPEETKNLMFGEERSLFHLEPTQAIESSFKSIESHSERMHQATELALKYLLNEFSPETLLKRFETYRKNAPDNVDKEAWAWKMYQSYFSELTSGRQKGFEKQFWEVLEQSYDTLQCKQP
ncbi:type VI secretion system-associated FHA domain protein TagH [Vibrio sp. CK2-1]|uniref:type VI secretion system-associated FHA domain protein TagH n=1 Tax=Vibrio sp. CK2-1 TaxID=2912249 RepID=UPI001F00D06B|nr:type VI secretion system-associated FHA domain protein TagH [Vibrio sp. CK2-1]MCF7354519.1 type VI secretion system-associated FHA domain protein TagH [Vibrio sp. CK2-1]